MNLTRACSYAFHALRHLASLPEGKIMASHTIARKCGIPERFLLKVLKPLADRGILRSMKGPNGGYRLGMAAGAISLTEVIEAVDGPIRARIPIAPATHPIERDLDEKLQATFDKMTADTRRQLDRVHIADLARSNPDRATGRRAAPRKASTGKGT